MSIEQLSKDILEFLSLLYKHKVKYVIVGGAAVIYHGYSRYTGDIDIYFDITDENIENLHRALVEFWKNEKIPGIENKAELKEAGIVLQFGQPPNRIDLINRIDGVTFNEVYENSIEEGIDQIKGVSVKIIAKQQLLKNKTASSRPKDLDDVNHLN